MSIKLRELIRNIRTCKTMAEERAVIAKECAAIRTAFREDDGQHRHRNVAKLLFIHMLGYPTNFGQMECLKLIASIRFPEKRIGYLGLTQLLDENTEVLMLVTNSIKNDLASPNHYIQGLGIIALGNVGTAEMCGALAREIEQVLGSNTAYVRKKAALCAMRVVRKCDEMLDKFCTRVRPLLEDKNHGVILSGIHLITSILKDNPEYIPQFRDTIPTLTRLLKTMNTGGYTIQPEYEIQSITDPFLQCAIIHLLKILGQGNAAASEQMNECLAMLATNVDNSKNIGNSILYETVQTIFGIHADAGLRTLAITVLGKLLSNKDNNIRYVALATLQKVVKVDLRSVQKHRQTILECLKDPDISLQKRALAVLYAIIDENNVKSMMKELLNFLLVADPEVKEDLVLKICHVIDRWGPDRRWELDQMVKVMCLAGNFVQEETRNYFCRIVGSTPELHEYIAHKMYYSMLENMGQESLIICGIWCVGEYGDLLISGNAKGPDGVLIRISPNEVLTLLDTITKKSQYSGESGFSGLRKNTLVLEYVVTACIKLVPKMPNEVMKIRQILKRYETHISPELQQRACEYQEILNPIWNSERAELLARVPAMEARVSKKEIGTTAIEEVGSRGGGNGGGADDLLGMGASNSNAGGDNILDMLSGPAAPVQSQNKSKGDDLLDLLGGGPSMPVAQSAVQSSGGGMDDLLNLGGAPAQASAGGGGVQAGGGLDDLLGGLSIGGGKPAAAAPAAAAGGLDDLLGGGTPAGPVEKKFVAFNKGGLAIQFTCVRENPTCVKVVAAFNNHGCGVPLTDFSFEVAVPKNLKLNMHQAVGGNVLQPNLSNVSQTFQIATPPGHTNLAIRIRLSFKMNGQQQNVMETVDQFPEL